MLLPMAANAQIYRWTDSAGVIHFGQNPPDDGKYTRMKLHDRTSGVNTGVSSAALDSLKASEKAQNLDDQARRAVVQAKAERAERCAKARERISFLEQQTAHRLYTKGGDGQPERVTDEQYGKMLGDAQKQASDSCGG